MRDARCDKTGAECFRFNLDGKTFAQAQMALEETVICRALTMASFNRTRAAEIAGMSLSAFRERLAKYDFEVKVA